MFVLFLRVNTISDSFPLFMFRRTGLLSVQLPAWWVIAGCLVFIKSLTPGIVCLVVLLKETAGNQFPAQKHSKFTNWVLVLELRDESWSNHSRAAWMLWMLDREEREGKMMTRDWLCSVMRGEVPWLSSKFLIRPLGHSAFVSRSDVKRHVCCHLNSVQLYRFTNQRSASRGHFHQVEGVEDQRGDDCEPSWPIYVSVGRVRSRSIVSPSCDSERDVLAYFHLSTVEWPCWGLVLSHLAGLCRGSSLSIANNKLNLQSTPLEVWTPPEI